MVRVIFVTGFNRSGTTLVTSAVTEATKAGTLTAGILARHMPSVDEFLTESKRAGTAPDRGVDRLPVTESTPEEYGWLLRAKAGHFNCTAETASSGLLQGVINEIAADAGSGTVVLKNPWDVLEEQILLDHFPDSCVLLIRRRLASIEDSLDRAWTRMAGSHGYIRALIGDPALADGMIGAIVDPEARAAMVADNKNQMRDLVGQWVESSAALPLDRVAFLSYDELRDNPRAGAAWAAHLVDPDALAESVAGLTFAEYNSSAPTDPSVRDIDTQWEQAWQRARQRQVAAGVVVEA